MGGIDIVIDDGSHVASHQRTSFEFLYPLLNVGGVYLVEDLHTAYWRGYFEGGIRRKGTFIEEMKSLVDDIHHPWHGKRQHFPDAHQNVGAIHFYDSIVVVEKRSVLPARHAIIGKP